MRCPFCSHDDDRVIDSRAADGGVAIRRRRECEGCGRRFTTYEHVESSPLMVVKKNGQRETFNRQKILSGFLKACEKRPISSEDIDRAVNRIASDVRSQYEREVSSGVIGEKVSACLKELDQVAYVRFASVYKDFKDINEFMIELKDLLKKDIRNE